MLESIKLIYHQVIEARTQGGMKDIFRPRVYWKRVATPVVMELSTSNLPQADQLQSSDLQFFEIIMDDMRTGKFSFAIPSRRLKAWRNLKRGFRCFAIREDSTVVGDVWCLTPPKDGKPITHPDLTMLGISSGKGDVYAFDMLIAPAYRGKNLSVPIQKLLHEAMKKEGYQRVYGFYWNDNLPALWTHRIVRYKELPRREISRFFFLSKSVPAGPNQTHNNSLRVVR